MTYDQMIRHWVTLNGANAYGVLSALAEICDGRPARRFRLAAWVCLQLQEEDEELPITVRCPSDWAACGVAP